ncbi:uncharacterized protein [Oryza sativa Japonica Group]|uniref:uncharacterized protein n=1 Tax=Oryza sativa subsp. japonica TaxID=39947 RepID=UPI00339CC5B2
MGTSTKITNLDTEVGLGHAARSSSSSNAATALIALHRCILHLSKTTRPASTRVRNPSESWYSCVAPRVGRLGRRNPSRRRRPSPPLPLPCRRLSERPAKPAAREDGGGGARGGHLPSSWRGWTQRQWPTGAAPASRLMAVDPASPPPDLARSQLDPVAEARARRRRGVGAGGRDRRWQAQRRRRHGRSGGGVSRDGGAGAGGRGRLGGAAAVAGGSMPGGDGSGAPRSTPLGRIWRMGVVGNGGVGDDGDGVVTAVAAALGQRQLATAVSAVVAAVSSGNGGGRHGVGLLAVRWWRATAQQRFAEAVVGVGGSGDGGCDSGGGGDVGGGEGVGGEVAGCSGAKDVVVVTVFAVTGGMAALVD